MATLFFTWALRENMKVHFEFLDNSVPFGVRPRTAAFGWNGEMNVLDVKCLIDVDRYRHIDVNAKSPDRVYRDGGRPLDAANMHFLIECATRLPALNFADRDSGRVYARFERGRAVWADAARLASALEGAELRAAFDAIAPGLNPRAIPGSESTPVARVLDPARFHTLGDWGSALRAPSL